METNQNLITFERKTLFSTLWIFVLLNIIFRDIHELPEFITEMMAGSITIVPEEIMLLGAIIIEIPIAMVLLSRVLKYGTNRWANIIAAVLVITSVIVFPPSDLDDFFFAAVEIGALVFIIWYAWKWPSPALDHNQPG